MSATIIDCVDCGTRCSWSKNTPAGVRRRQAGDQCAACYQKKRAAARKFQASVTEYRGLTLRPDRYQRSDVADMYDDGHVDEVAVERTVHGRRNGARLTAREVACVVYRAARNGMADKDIAALLGDDVTPALVLKVRDRNGITSRYHEMQQYASNLAA